MNIIEGLIDDQVKKEIKTWIDKEFSAAKIRAAVRKQLEAQTDSTLKNIIGFEKKWGGSWELDHCNGRSGNSVAGDFINENVKKEVEAWIKRSVGNLKPLSKSAIDSLQKAYHTGLEREIRSRLSDMAKKEAGVYVNNILESICSVSENLKGS